MRPRFTETQKFGWWVWLLMIPVCLIPVVGLVVQMGFGKDFGNNPISNGGLIFLLMFGLVMIGLFSAMKMKTLIDEKHITINFFPLAKKSVTWDEVKNANVINYGFVGGWGVRLWTKYGTVYNMRGNKGLAIELKNGKRFLIGTQKEKELDKFIKTTRA